VLQARANFGIGTLGHRKDQIAGLKASDRGGHAAYRDDVMVPFAGL
jgi:hypothetical protein